MYLVINLVIRFPSWIVDSQRQRVSDDLFHVTKRVYNNSPSSIELQHFEKCGWKTFVNLENLFSFWKSNQHVSPATDFTSEHFDEIRVTWLAKGED